MTKRIASQSSERGLGLGAHAPGERLAVAFFEPGGVDDGEGEIAEPRLALAPVARHAGLIVDQRQLLADQPVEQRRLADVGPADDRDLAHGVCIATWSEGTISSPVETGEGDRA